MAVYEAQRGGTKFMSRITLWDTLRKDLEWSEGTGPGGAFVFSGALGFGTMICFVDESPDSIPLSERNPVRSFLPIAEPMLDMARACDWISVCESDHGDACNPR